MKPPLVRCSAEHIAEVAEIENRYNNERDSARKLFKASHPAADLETSEAWAAIRDEIEGRRMEELRVMRLRVIDLA